MTARVSKKILAALSGQQQNTPQSSLRVIIIIIIVISFFNGGLEDAPHSLALSHACRGETGVSGCLKRQQ